MRLGTSPKPDAEVGIRSSGRHTPIEIKNKKKLEVTPVPAAIATKSSKVSINERIGGVMSRRTNSSKVLEQQASFIDTTNAVGDQKLRIKKLGSFNDDLRDVTYEKGQGFKINSPIDLKATVNNILHNSR